jgi:hypothetical protein
MEAIARGRPGTVRLRLMQQSRRCRRFRNSEIIRCQASFRLIAVPDGGLQAAGVGLDQLERSCDCRSSFGLRGTSTHDATTKAMHVARALDWKRSVKVPSGREEDCGCGASAPHPHGGI